MHFVPCFEVVPQVLWTEFNKPWSHKITFYQGPRLTLFTLMRSFVLMCISWFIDTANEQNSTLNTDCLRYTMSIVVSYHKHAWRMSIEFHLPFSSAREILTVFHDMAFFVPCEYSTWLTRCDFRVHHWKVISY